MSLEEKIIGDIKDAMRAKEKEKLESLRAIKAALLLEKTQKGGTDKISGETEMKILQKLVKQRKDSAQIYADQGRNDLAEKELLEAKIIEAYLPEQMSDEKLTSIIKKLLKKLVQKLWQTWEELWEKLQKNLQVKLKVKQLLIK